MSVKASAAARRGRAPGPPRRQATWTRAARLGRAPGPPRRRAAWARAGPGAARRGRAPGPPRRRRSAWARAGSLTKPRQRQAGAKARAERLRRPTNKTSDGKGLMDAGDLRVSMWRRRSGGGHGGAVDEGASRAGARVRGPVDEMSIIYRPFFLGPEGSLPFIQRQFTARALRVL
jgi:hypothetical protein